MPILTAEERLGTNLVGRYRLDEVLGTGGMGILFLAVDASSNTRVAVKMLKPEHSANRDRVARFVRETRIAGTLQHPNIARVFDSGTDDTGAPYFVMELLNGRSFEDELAERGAIPYAEAVGILLPIARALAVAHARGVIHRDLKPSNIFLCRGADGSVVPKLLDFGIAKCDVNDFETQTGLVVGSPSYMAPEQARDGECGAYTDIWGIAAVLYRAVTGTPPHAAESVHEMLALRVREPASPFVVPGVKKSVCAVVDRALERDPERRHRTMHAFISALGGAPTPEGELTREGTRELCADTFEMPSLPPERRPTPNSGIGKSSLASRRGRSASFAAAASVMLLVIIGQFVRRSEGVTTQQQALARQNHVAAEDANLGPPPIAPLRRQGEAKAEVSNELPHPALESAIAPAAPAARARKEPATHPQNPRKQSADSAKPISAPEFERRTGLPLATEW